MKLMVQLSFRLVAACIFTNAPAAIAEVIKIPCEEYVRLTNDNVNCEKYPILVDDRQEYEALKRAIEKVPLADRKAYIKNIPPWERPNPPVKESTEAERLATCDLPPWFHDDICNKSNK